MSMKHSGRAVWLLSIVCITIYSSNSIYSGTKPKISLYQQLLFLKQIACFSITLCRLHDWTVVDKAKIACDVCNYAITSPEFYGYMVDDHMQIAMLSLYWRNGDIADTEDFMCYYFNKLEVQCPMCSIYYGWHVINTIEIQ